MFQYCNIVPSLFINYVNGSESAGENVAVTSACKEKTLREVSGVSSNREAQFICSISRERRLTGAAFLRHSRIAYYQASSLIVCVMRNHRCFQQIDGEP